MNCKKDQLVKAMDSVKATEELKRKTLSAVAAKAPKAKALRQKRLTAALAVCGALLLLFTAVGLYLYSSPVSAISIDVNPSVELEMNLFGRVLSCKAYNDDGAAVAEKVNVKNMSYADAVKTILHDEAFRKYIKNDSYVVITVAGDRVEEIAGVLSKVPTVERLSAAVETAAMETVGEAHDCGFSFGKYKAYLELKALDGGITEEEAKTMTMHELRSRIIALGGTVNGGCEADEGDCDADGSHNGLKGSGQGNGLGQEGHGHGKNRKQR